MHFICDGREYDTDDMHLVATGQASMPLLFIGKDFRDVVAVVRSRAGVSARAPTQAELERLQREAPNAHLATYLSGGR
jgi:hypothetical protein